MHVPVIDEARHNHTQSQHPLQQHPPSTASLQDDVALQDPLEVLVPPPSAWTARASHYHPDLPSPLEDFPPPNSSSNSQRASTFLDKCKLPPLVSRASTFAPTHSRSRSQSPAKSISNFITSLSNNPITESESPNKANNRRGRPASSFHDWFYGESAPLQIGILPSPTKEEPGWDDEDYDEMFSRATTSPASRSPTTKARSNTVTSTAGKFSWFTKGSAPAQERPSPKSRSASSDPFYDLDIQASLFPHGPLDPLAPNSYHDLLTAAEDTIRALQATYQTKCDYLDELVADRDIKVEEAQEADTRARHLKVQLDDMAARASQQAAEHEKLVREMSDELAHERRLRREEEEVRKRSIKIVTEDSDELNSRHRRRENRRSHQSNASITDSGFESSEESESESVFSHKHKHSDVGSPATTATSFDEPSHRSKPSLTITDPSGYGVIHHAPSIQSIRPTSTAMFHAAGRTSMSIQGLDLINENYFLRGRVQELEEAVDNCLDMVSCMR